MAADANVKQPKSHTNEILPTIRLPLLDSTSYGLRIQPVERPPESPDTVTHLNYG